MLEIHLFGRFEILLDGQALEIPSRPAQALLAYLALHPGIAHRRERLAGLLWPKSDERKARRTFLDMTALAGTADLLIAYLPTVSMGTAMEMWQAYQSDTYIVAVTPHVHHWAIRFTADEILPDLDTLLARIENGTFSAVLQKKQVDVGADAD